MPPIAAYVPAYIIAARRTAIGRIGGLHRSRRIEELSAPLVAAVLRDCGLEPGQIDEIIVGNATQSGNPARLIALAAGLPEAVSATTIDRQCGSGLDAILSAIRRVALGEAEAILAGGAETVSTAPWRISKPKSLYQLPHFMSFEPSAADEHEVTALIESSEALSLRLGISRAQQDAFALRTYLKAQAAHTSKRLVGEIVPLRANAEEARDQSAVEPDYKDLAQLAPYLAPDGTLTPGNTSAVHDGGAMAVVVSERLWTTLGKPRAMRLIAQAARGVAPDAEASAPLEAMSKLNERMNGYKPADISVIEMSESSAAQAIALLRRFELDEDVLNPDGGAIARGHPYAAAGAVLIARLFTRMARNEEKAKLGVATLGVMGGMGLAALFEAV
jgi:acetyl-CoA C-acetyltransferase